MWKQWGLKKQARDRDLSHKYDGNIRYRLMLKYTYVIDTYNHIGLNSV